MSECVRTSGYWVRFSVLLFLLTGFREGQAQELNTGFEKGLKGWSLEGDKGHVTLDKQHPYQGKACARIAGYGGLGLRVNAAPLIPVQFNVFISSLHAGLTVFPYIRFYDSLGKELLEYKTRQLCYTNWESTGNYTETPANTRWLEIGIRTDPSNGGVVFADNFSIELDPGMPAEKPAPLCNIDEYMRPFWHSDTVFNETVLLYAAEGQPASGKLLYMPDSILSVKSFDEKTVYHRETDYFFDKGLLVRTGGSRMPFKSDTSFSRKNLAWYDLQSKWVVVTYTHKDPWEGPVPAYKADKLPNTLAKLRSKSPLNIVAYGMSITRGMNSSGHDNIPPYMPGYIQLFANRLGTLYGDKSIRLFNAALPGSLVSWGAAYADKYVSPLHPDLVILDFGMNDFWSVWPDEFKTFIRTIIAKVRETNPSAEFILLSNMLFDPTYISDEDDKKHWYLANMLGYNKSLQEMQDMGIINLDMTTLSEFIYGHKKAKDCLSNPLHPNDWMTRWYAQSLTALFEKP